MRVVAPFKFPPEQWQARAKAKRLEWLSIVLMILAATGLGITHGGSQAMKTVWIGDILAIIPPAIILVGYRFELKPANERFPWGYYRAIATAFLATASMHTIMGLFLLYDSVMKLIKSERPPIGLMELFGRQFWHGWAMIAALAFSAAIGFTIGKLKGPVAEKLHDKTLEADAALNRSDWLSEVTAIAGILLVGFGFWWADSITAAFVSFEIVRDGISSLREVIRDLMDETPTEMGKSELETLPKKLKRAAERIDWVSEASVRLREHGHILTGDVFIVPREGMDMVKRVEETTEQLQKLDWRLHGLQIVLVSKV